MTRLPRRHAMASRRINPLNLPLAMAARFDAERHPTMGTRPCLHMFGSMPVGNDWLQL